MYFWSNIRKVSNGPKNIFFYPSNGFCSHFHNFILFFLKLKIPTNNLQTNVWCFINQRTNNFLQFTFFASNWICFFSWEIFLMNQKYMRFWLTKTACNFGPLNLISDHFKHIYLVIHTYFGHGNFTELDWMQNCVCEKLKLI